MAKIYSIANQKGGVGKTTTAVNLAAALAEMSVKVLIIDLDPQGNATTGCGVDKTTVMPGVYEVLNKDATVAEAIKPAKKGLFDVLGTNRRLAGVEEELIDRAGRELRLAEALDSVQENYDTIIIDCPPALSMLTVNAFCASQGLVIPMTCEYFSLEGVSDLVLSVKAVRDHINPELVISGLLRVKFDPRITLQREVSDQLTSFFGDRVYRTVIPTNVRLAEAPSYGLPGVLYDKSCRGSQAYRFFAQEFVTKEKIGQRQQRKRK